MEVITTSKKIPTEKEIQDLEARAAQLRQAREQAKKEFLNAFKTGEVVNALSASEAMGLMRLLQSKFQGARRKVRGSVVNPELKASLEDALKQGQYTLSQLEKMFNLSVSYISRVKKEMREKGILPPLPTGYTDHPLRHQTEQQQGAQSA
jgi:hypothetical protein